MLHDEWLESLHGLNDSIGDRAIVRIKSIG